MKLARRALLKLLPALPAVFWLKPSPASAATIPFRMRFAVASDGHYGQPGTDFEKFHSDVIRWLNQEKMQKGLDFAIFNGDLIHDEPMLMYDVKTAFKRLAVPFFVTRGNHDRVGLDVWESTWGYPTNHSFARGEYAFILGDTSNEKGEFLCPDPAWLRREITKYENKKGIFVFLHITPVKWSPQGRDCEEVRELLEKTPNIRAIFHGHEHNEDGGKMSGGKPFFYDGHFGGSWGTTYKGYRIVEIHEDGTWKSYQYNPTAAPILNTFEGKS